MDIIYKVDDDCTVLMGETGTQSDVPFCLSLESKWDHSREFFKILGVSASQQEESPYLKIGKALSLTKSEVFRIMPKDQRINLMQEPYEKLIDCLYDKENEVYVQSYLRQKNFLRSLSKPLVDKNYLRKYASDIEHDHIRQKVTKYADSIKKTKYSMSGTSTGRLVVTDGPNILTLPSEVRGAIMPTTSNGAIYQLDLVAAEPHLALLVAEKDPPEDIYTHIADSLLESKVSRKTAKLITLSALYGQSARRLSEALPKGINSYDVIKKTKEYFQSNRLKRILRESLEKDNLRNILGRPLHLDKKRPDLAVSHYLQSSIAECSILLFSEFCKQYQAEVLPFYVIHDALIFEGDKEFIDTTFKNDVVNLPMGSWNFQAKFSKVENIYNMP